MTLLKDLRWVLLLAAAICGCNQAHKDSAEKADSSNMTRDSGEKEHPAPRGYEINGEDAKFAVKAAAGGLKEVELGKLAIQKGSSQMVKNFGAMMVKDHSAANNELAELAKSKKIELPNVLDSKAIKLKEQLGAKSGKDFDKAYTVAMIKDHAEDTTEFAHAIKVVKYPEMTAYAKKTLPILKMHLLAAKKIESESDFKLE
jgi:putative membrane protein